MMFVRFAILLGVKVFARTFYRFKIFFVGGKPKHAFRNVRIGNVLNHTSLFDPLFLGALPVSFLWDLAERGTFPGADITMSRPIVGRFMRMLAGNVVSVSRRRDETWDTFLAAVGGDNSVTLIAPEGRMKRPDGFDKHGRPMTVRGGIVDVIRAVGHGRLVNTYCGGLHHVQSPGQKFPKLFKTVTVGFEVLDIMTYVQSFGLDPKSKEFKLAVCKDMERRRDLYCGLTPAPELAPG